MPVPVLLRRVALVALLSAAVAAPARAEEPKLEVPASAQHNLYDMLMADGALPEGWKLAPREAAKEGEAAVVAAVAAAGGAGTKAEARTVAAPDGRGAVVVLADLAAAPAEEGKALHAAAAAQGGVARSLGHPTRWVVVTGAAKDEALGMQLAWAAKMLAVKASASLERRNGPRALELARVVLELDPKHVVGHMVVGRTSASEAIELATREAEDAAPTLEFALRHLRAALAKDGTGTLTEAERTSTSSETGLALLYARTPAADAEARDLLKQAVAGAFGNEREALIARYNLACAHGRLKELDPAFAALTAALEGMAKLGGDLLGTWREDADFAHLKDDPRWAALDKRFPAKEGD